MANGRTIHSLRLVVVRGQAASTTASSVFDHDDLSKCQSQRCRNESAEIESATPRNLPSRFRTKKAN